MKIAIICPYSFPFGMAASNRIAAYTEGLKDNGAQVDVLIIRPTDYYTDKQSPNIGCYHGVKYNYLCGKYANKYHIIRILYFLSGVRLFEGIYRTYRHLKLHKYDVIIISYDDPIFLFLYSQLAKFYRIKSVFIFDEYPEPIRRKLKNKIPKYKEWLYKKILKGIDGYISISNELKDYFCKFVNKPSIVVPLIVNTERFKPINVERKKHISYIGNMELSKDNVDNIIKAFSLISDKFFEYSLHFYGNPTVQTKKLLEDLIHSLNMEHRIVLEGRIDSESVPMIIASSAMMVSSQPDTLRAKGGFPTKLGEYVVMGTPTLICDVGENSSFLKDGIDCFFVQPNNPTEYSLKMEYILNNYEQALSIAKQGEVKIRNCFSQTVVGKYIFNFLNGLISND